jgi:hypothetical protein
MAEPDPQIPVLEALIAHAEVQLAEAWAEVRDQNTYALALAALGIAVIGIIAAVQAQLGGDWWVPIPGLVLTSIVALVGTQDYGEVATKDALAQLLSDLRATRIEEIPSALDSQRRALLIVAGLFAITAVYSTLLLV